MPDDKWTTLANIVTGGAQVPDAGLVTFKSVGTALQDLALAARYYELLGQKSDAKKGVSMGSLRAQPGGRGK
jgi:ornithine cyclodeaminase/alanine dehydrogenase-like protein (mu-crystallin family)